MKRHALLILLRLLMAVGLAYALPESHLHWGEAYPGDGQSSLSMLMTFLFIGCVFSAAYFAFGTAVQYFIRRKQVRWTLIFDVVLFASLACLLIYCGVTAHYPDADGQADEKQSNSHLTSPVNK